MQFDVVVGNPPYHLGRSGGEAIGGFAMPIYQKFVLTAKDLDPGYVVMVTPSRWFAGGRSLDKYRNEMLADRRIRRLVDFPDATEAFPGTKIEGGVSYFLWDSSWNGACGVTTIMEGKPTSAPMKRRLGTHDILVRWNEAVPILRKIQKINAEEGIGNLSGKVSPIQPFAIRTNYSGKKRSTGMREPVRLIKKGGEAFIERSSVPRNDSWIDKWKVLLGRAYGAGNSFPRQVYNRPIIAGPESVCTETYLVMGCFEKKTGAERLAGYLRTRFVRFLVSLRKNTQDIYNKRFLFVPDLPMNRNWTDDALYEKYGITDREIRFISGMVRSMDKEND